MSIKKLIAPKEGEVERWREKVAQIINSNVIADEKTVSVKDYGAKGDGKTDDSSAIQNALDSDYLNIFLPPGVYLCGTQITIRKRCHFWGAGAGISYIYSTVTGTNDGMVLQPNANQGEFWHLHDFSVYQATDGNGRYGIQVYLAEGATYYFVNFCIERVAIHRFGSQGLCLRNDYQNTNGIYLGTIRRCFIDNGILTEYIGDSISIVQNQITGDNVGILAKMISGSRQLVISENSITTDDGGIALSSAFGAKIYNNQIEGLSSTDYAGSYNAQVYIGGTSVACQVRDNNITSNLQGTKPDYAFVIDEDADNNEITGNELTKGTIGHGYVTAGATANIVGPNYYNDAAETISDNGTNTKRAVLSAFTVDTTAAGAGTDGTISSRSANPLGECTGFLVKYKADGTKIYLPYWEDIAPSA